MKKKLRLQINKLANKLLSEEHDFDVSSLKQTALELYERLAILEYLESQIEDSLGPDESRSLDSKSFREVNWFTEPEPVPQPENKEELIEPLMEKIKDIVAQMPAESQRIDELIEEVLPKKKYIKNDLEEFAASYQQTPVFERKEPTKGGEIPKKTTELIADIGAQDKPRSINDKLHKGLNIGLNDRLAFIKHLFEGKADAYSRVLDTITTMPTYEHADAYVKGKVKPEYNYWLQKDEYSKRFMSIIEKSFE